jgi:hypothetical protein
MLFPRLAKRRVDRNHFGARGGCTSIAIVANFMEVPQRAQAPLPGMFSNLQFAHCMAYLRC